MSFMSVQFLYRRRFHTRYAVTHVSATARMTLKNQSIASATPDNRPPCAQMSSPEAPAVCPSAAPVSG